MHYLQNLHYVLCVYVFQAKVSGSKSEGSFEEALQKEKEANGAPEGAQEVIPEEKQ